MRVAGRVLESARSEQHLEVVDGRKARGRSTSMKRIVPSVSTAVLTKMPVGSLTLVRAPG